MKKIFAICFLMLSITGNVFADEVKIISEGEKIASVWKLAAQNGIYIPPAFKGKNFSYDIQKTNSIIKPYEIIIEFYMGPLEEHVRIKYEYINKDKIWEWGGVASRDNDSGNIVYSHIVKNNLKTFSFND